VPEQWLYYTYESGRGLERMSQSSRARGSTLFSDAEAKQFAEELEKIHEEFVDREVGRS
jgi:hypothetical protein